MEIIRKKIITKHFKRNWPFTVDKITLCNIGGAIVYCYVNNSTNIALNGASIDILNLNDPFKSGFIKYDIVNNEKVYWDIAKYIKKGYNLFSDNERVKLAKLDNYKKMMNEMLFA
jgi:hypothetical protein